MRPDTEEELQADVTDPHFAPLRERSSFCTFLSTAQHGPAVQGAWHYQPPKTLHPLEIPRHWVIS